MKNKKTEISTIDKIKLNALNIFWAIFGLGLIIFELSQGIGNYPNKAQALGAIAVWVLLIILGGALIHRSIKRWKRLEKNNYETPFPKKSSLPANKVKSEPDQDPEWSWVEESQKTDDTAGTEKSHAKRPHQQKKSKQEKKLYEMEEKNKAPSDIQE